MSHIIDIQNVYQSYDDDQIIILKELNLKIEKGRFVGLMGMSGCGKSTILRYIAGLQTPTKGLVKLRNQTVSRENRAAMVFQQYSSLPWLTVLENASLALKYKGLSKKERASQAMEILKKVGLEGHEHKYAQYPNLSGGQLQRVAIARSLLANSDILLMDEPFGALDINTRMQMQDLLLGIWKEYQPTIIFVTHDISEAVYLSEEVLLMKYPPSKIAKRIEIDLGRDRNASTKRESHFTELVHVLEDQMIELSNEPMV